MKLYLASMGLFRLCFGKITWVCVIPRSVVHNVTHFTPHWSFANRLSAFNHLSQSPTLLSSCLSMTFVNWCMFHFNSSRKPISFTERKWVKERDEKKKSRQNSSTIKRCRKTFVLSYTNALCNRTLAPYMHGLVFVSLTSWYFTERSTMSREM